MKRIEDLAVDDAPHAAATGAVSPPRWQLAMSLRVSAALHVGGALAVGLQPEVWPLVAGALVANHCTLFGASFLPKSRLLGPNIVRLPEAAIRRGEVALTFDDGPDPEVTPRVLDLLDAYGARASFFCIGERAAAFPDLVRDISRRGHSVENHSHRHSTRFGWYGLGRLRRELQAAQSTLGEISGRAPAFFRAPFGVRSPLLDPALAECGLRYVSWTRRGYDTVDGSAPSVLRRLTRNLAAGDVLLLHDGGPIGERRGAPSVLAVLPALLHRFGASGLKPVSLPAACA